MICIMGGKTGAIGQALVHELGAVALGRDMLVPEGDSPLHLVCATGVSHSAMIHKAQTADIYDTFEGNLHVPMRALATYRPVWKRRTGSFTIIGSICAELGMPGTMAYSATKAALHGVVKVGCREFAPFCRVNLIELGYMDMGIIAQVPDCDALIRDIPMGRLGRASDLAAAVRFAIECEWLTGAVIPLNGGQR